MRIGLDVDGVLYQFSKTAQYMIARREGYETREELGWDDTTWDCHRPPSDWHWVLSSPQAEKVFRHGHLFRGAIEFVDDLAELGDVIIITKRPRAAIQTTLDWLSFNRFPITEVCVLGSDRLKSAVPADVYIDDSLENIDELAKHTWSDIVLIDRPWNQRKKLPPRTFRARDFKEAYTIVRRVLQPE